MIEALKSPNYNLLAKDTPQIFFIGNSISPEMLNETVALCEGKDICVNVISKSGTTTEPAIAFRVFREMVNKKYSAEEAAKRIFCTTDQSKGTLKALADAEAMRPLSCRIMWVAVTACSPPWVCCPSLLPVLILML